MNSPTYKCPKCDGTNFKRWQLPHPIILHWVLNPGLAFNEIVLGQRLPKTQLICQECEGPLLDRAYIPCPSCAGMHLGRNASGARGFGNWRGFGCPSCKEPIPCIWNLFSILILLVTFPLWAIPYFFYFRNRPLRPLFQLEDRKPPALKPLPKSSWIFMGVAWGAAMWLITVSTPDVKSLGLMGLPIFTLGGFTFGFLMWFFLGRTRNKTDRDNKAV